MVFVNFCLLGVIMSIRCLSSLHRLPGFSCDQVSCKLAALKFRLRVSSVCEYLVDNAGTARIHAGHYRNAARVISRSFKMSICKSYSHIRQVNYVWCFLHVVNDCKAASADGITHDTFSCYKSSSILSCKIQLFFTSNMSIL